METEVKQEVKQAKQKNFVDVLHAEKKVRIRIAKKNEKDTADVPVSINGYTYLIKKDETVEVPETVAKILEEARYI